MLLNYILFGNNIRWRVFDVGICTSGGGHSRIIYTYIYIYSLGHFSSQSTSVRVMGFIFPRANNTRAYRTNREIRKGLKIYYYYLISSRSFKSIIHYYTDDDDDDEYQHGYNVVRGGHGENRRNTTAICKISAG